MGGAAPPVHHDPVALADPPLPMQIHVVDDEACWRDTLTWQLRGLGHPVRSHRDGEALAAGLSDALPNCVLLDWHLGAELGADVLRALPAGATPRTVVAMSADGAAETVVAALRAGAEDFVVKDRGAAAFARAVAEAGERLAARRPADDAPAAAARAVAGLSAREREVLARIADGHGTKAIAHALALSPRTVEMHRTRLRDRLGVGSMHQAVGLWRLAAG